MTEDYLWDGSGTPDPDVARLERLLGRLRSTPPVPVLPEAPSAWRSARFLAPLAAAAALVAAMVAGTVRDAGRSAREVARIRPGDTLVTDGASHLRVDIGAIGYVDVDPNSRLRVVDTREGRHQLALARGTLHAHISAPPGQFIVETPSGTATDLGCAYKLTVDEDGSGLLSVSAGWVALDAHGRESFVPAGASCRTHPTRGPGTPRFDDEPQEFSDALDRFDFAPDPASRAEALRFILEHRGSADAVTLWHLIPRVDPDARGAVVDALADQVAMPAGVTRDAILRLDRAALDAWWAEQGLGSAEWWRHFKNW